MEYWRPKSQHPQRTYENPPTYKLSLCCILWNSAVAEQFPMSRSPALGHLADPAQPTLGTRLITCRSHCATIWKHFNTASRKHGTQNYFSWAKTMFIDFDPYLTGVAACGVEGRYLNVIIIRVIFSPIESVTCWLYYLLVGPVIDHWSPKPYLMSIKMSVAQLRVIVSGGGACQQPHHSSN